MKHTPSPWEVMITPSGYRAIRAKDSDGEQIRISTMNSNDIDESTEHANAKLIAAAPDLLEALKGLFESCPVDRNDMISAFISWRKHSGAAPSVANDKLDKWCDAMISARDAIRKAE